MENGNDEDRLPSGFLTWTMERPGEVMRLAGTLAVSCVAEANVVASGKEFHRTSAPELKFEPLRVIVNAGPPAAVEFGFKEVRTGGVVVCAWQRAANPSTNAVRQALNLICADSFTGEVLHYPILERC